MAASPPPPRDGPASTRCDRGIHDGSFLALPHTRCYAAPAMDLSGKKFGMLLSTGPEDATNLDAAVGLSQAALARGANLYLYLIDDGVRALDDARVRALPERGAKLFVCAYGCQKRRVPLDHADLVTYCGLVVLTDLINATERFIALNRAHGRGRRAGRGPHHPGSARDGPRLRDHAPRPR